MVTAPASPEFLELLPCGQMASADPLGLSNWPHVRPAPAEWASHYHPSVRSL